MFELSLRYLAGQRRPLWSAKMEPEVVSVAEAQAMTRLGETKVYELIKKGDLVSIKIGRRRLIRLDSIRRLTGTQVAA